MIRTTAVAFALTLGLAAPAAADDPMLTEAVDFTGAVLFVSNHVPGMVIGAVRNGETAVAGFGSTRSDGGREPDGDTVMRIGSVTKVFAGLTLAHLAAEGQLRLTDPVEDHLDWDIAFPTKDGKRIRLLDIATHSSGLPRQAEVPPGPPDNPDKFRTDETLKATLAKDSLIYAPGTGIFYSNFAYDVLAAALSHTAGMPYDELLRSRVLDPLGLAATSFAPTAAQQENMMQGHDWHGNPMPDIVSVPGVYGSGGLFSTTNDMLRWLQWNLDRFGAEGAEARALSQAAYIYREGHEPVYGMDESGHMDAMGLGWVIMLPSGDRPLILQKAGGAQGIFVYAAFAPSRGVGAFIAINQYDFPLAMGMAETVNDLIGQLAPR